MIQIFQYSDSVTVKCPYPQELEEGQRFAIEGELEEARHFTEGLDDFRGAVNHISHRTDVTLNVVEKD